MHDGFEYRAHVGAQPLAYGICQRLGPGIERQSPIERDQLAGVGGPDQVAERGRKRADALEGEQGSNAGRSIEAPALGSPARISLVRHRQVL